MLKESFDRLMVWTVDHRKFTAGIVVAITLLAIVGYLRPQWVTQWFQAEETVAEDAETGTGSQQQLAPDVDPVSLSESDAVIVVQSPAFFTPSG